MSVHPIPEGYHALTPYLVLDDVAGFLDYAKAAFDAEEIMRSPGPDGTLTHAELRVGDSRLMIGQAPPDHPLATAWLYHYVEDTDAVYRRAIEAGGTSVQEPADQFYGDRNAAVADPFGNTWWIATHVEDVSPEELGRRAAEHYGT